VLRSWKDNQKS